MVLRIFKIVVTSGFLTALECTKFVFGRGSAPDPTGGALGAYSAPPDHLAGLRGPTYKGEGRKGTREKNGRGREREGPAPLLQIPGSAPVETALHEWHWYTAPRGSLLSGS